MPCNMKSIGTLLIVLTVGCLGVNGFYYGEEGGPEEILDYDLARSMEPRFFNFSIDGIFNNSLLTLGGIFVLGVILFGKL